MPGLTQRYISKELIHFVGRGTDTNAQYALLEKIMSEGWITHPPHNPNWSGNLSVTAGNISENDMYSPEITCFADIPLSDLSIHMDKYSSIGVSFSKEFISNSGGVPVHYISQNSKVKKPRNLDGGELQRIIKEHGFEAIHDHMYEEISKAKHFDEMLNEYQELFRIFGELAMAHDTTPGAMDLSQRVTQLQSFFDFHIFSYFKFFDHSKNDDDPHNYYFEREWRVVGNVSFSITDIRTVFLPSKYSERFRQNFPQYSGQVIFTD